MEYHRDDTLGHSAPRPELLSPEFAGFFSLLTNVRGISPGYTSLHIHPHSCGHTSKLSHIINTSLTDVGFCVFHDKLTACFANFKMAYIYPAASTKRNVPKKAEILRIIIVPVPVLSKSVEWENGSNEKRKTVTDTRNHLGVVAGKIYVISLHRLGPACALSPLPQHKSILREYYFFLASFRKPDAKFPLRAVVQVIFDSMPKRNVRQAY